MDEEARIRGTTVYLVDKRIDMLPMMLGTDLCSLVGGRDRYAMSVLWVAPSSVLFIIVGNDPGCGNCLGGVYKICYSIAPCFLVLRSSNANQ